MKTVSALIIMRIMNQTLIKNINYLWPLNISIDDSDNNDNFMDDLEEIDRLKIVNKNQEKENSMYK